MLLIAVLFTTAQADYLGPNRVIVTYETIYQRQACRFVDVRDPAGPGVCACTMTVYTSPTGSCPGSVDSAYFSETMCQWSGTTGCPGMADSISGPSSSIQSCSLGDQACTAVVIEHRTTLAAATVSGAITCSTPGQNGWCVGPAVLNASGSEPLSGYSILTLEGTRNGESFACPGASCSNVPLSEGSNDFQFWAISSYGDSSAMGSASASVDTQAPTISGSLSGTQGENGWYTSAVTLSAAATDPTPGSGIASFEVSADGAAWQPCSGSLTLGDGVHTVSLRTADAAGWTASAEQTFSVDTQAPQLSADLSGNLVSPGRYNTSVTLSTSGSDTGSGLNRIEYQDNAGGWTTYTDPLIFYNGQHEIEVRAVDQAGLTSDVQTFSFFVESRGPYITVPDHWQVGQTISVSVQANSFSLGSVSIVVSDPQRRWSDVEQVYPASGDSFTTDFHWDGRFNGQTAPAGQYTVSVYASDVMSNLSVSHSQVTIPLVIPTAVPTLTATGTVAAAESTTAAAATVTPQPSSTPTAVAAGVPVTSFSSPASPVQQPAATLPSNVLWGGAAAAVIGAAVVETARKRKGEEEAKSQHGGGKPLNLLVEDSLASENESPHGAAQPAAKAKNPATIITAQNEETENSGFLGEYNQQALEKATDTDVLLVERLLDILKITAPTKGNSAQRYFEEASYFIDKYGWDYNRLQKYLENVVEPRMLKEEGAFISQGSSMAKSIGEDIGAMRDKVISGYREELDQKAQQLFENRANYSPEEFIKLKEGLRNETNDFEKKLQRANTGEHLGEIFGRGSSIFGSISIVSGVIGLATGSKEASTVSDVATVVSGGFDLLDFGRIVGSWITKTPILEHSIPTALTSSVLGKIAGPLSIAFGVIGIFNSASEIYNAVGPREKAIGILNLISGIASFGAGVCLYIPIPGFRAVSAALFAISGAVSAASVIVTHWDEIKNAVVTAPTMLQSAATGAAAAVKNVVTTAPAAIKSTAIKVVTTVKSVVTNTVTAVKSVAAKAVTAVKSAVANAITAVKSTATKVVTAVKSAVANMVTAVKSTAAKAVTAVKTIATKVTTVVKSTATKAVTVVKATATKTITSVKSAVTTAAKNIGTVIGKIFRK